MSTTDHGLEMWTVYDRPLDYPESFVARKTVVGASAVTMTREMFTADTLDELRALLPQSLYRVHRFVQDDVDEFSFRLNEGNVKHHTMTRLDSFVKVTAGKRLTYKALIH